MDVEKLFRIVLVDFSNDQLKLEVELEKAINSDMEINAKVKLIKTLLTQMSANDSSIARFTSMIEINNKNNTD